MKCYNIGLTCTAEPKALWTREPTERLCQLRARVLDTVYLVDEDARPRELVNKVDVYPGDFEGSDDYRVRVNRKPVAICDTVTYGRQGGPA